MKFTYCPECGGKLITKPIGDEGEIPYCGKCERPWFSFSYPCVICLLTDGERYALIRQTYGKQNYVCVAGFIKEGETAEQTAVREIREETGLEARKIRYIGSWYYPKHDNLMLGFVCHVDHAEFHLSRNEVSSAGWFDSAAARELLRESSLAGKLLEKWLGILAEEDQET